MNSFRILRPSVLIRKTSVCSVYSGKAKVELRKHSAIKASSSELLSQRSYWRFLRLARIPAGLQNMSTNSTKLIALPQRRGNEIHIVNSPPLLTEPGIAAKTFLNIVSILGLARTGKSTLINTILGENAFETSSDRRTCTKGVWLSNVTKDIGEDGVAVFMDTEGQGNDSVKNDNALLTPVMVLSKVIIFNISGQILVQDLLDRLALFVHIADRITLPNNGTFRFGHLIIAVRDYYFQGTAEDVYKDYFQRERGNVDSVITRNKIRQKLLSVFESIKVLLFPYPFGEGQFGNEGEIQEDFTQRVDELKEDIYVKVREPHSLRLTPGDVIQTIQMVVNELRKPGVMVLESVVVLLQKKEVDAAAVKFSGDFTESIHAIYLPTRGIETKLRNIFTRVVSQFDHETREGDLIPQYQNEVKERIQVRATTLLNDKITQNLNLQRGVINQAKSQIERGLTNNLRKIVLPQNPHTLNDTLEEIRMGVVRDFERRTVDADMAVDYATRTSTELQQYCQKVINYKKDENKCLIEQLEREKSRFVKNLEAIFLAIALPSLHIENDLEKASDRALREFEGHVLNIPSSEYKQQALRELQDIIHEQKEKTRRENKREHKRQLVELERRQREHKRQLERQRKRYFGFCMAGIIVAAGGALYFAYFFAPNYRWI